MYLDHAHAEGLVLLLRLEAREDAQLVPYLALVLRILKINSRKYFRNSQQ